MAWIESHQALAQHPKTKRFARLAEISIPCAIGHLHLLWWWCMTYAEDGNLSKWEVSDIADAVHWDKNPSKLVESLIDAKFIDSSNEGMSIHDWADYTGKLMEFRRKDRERKRKSSKTPRSSDVTVPNHTKPNRTEPYQPNQPNSTDTQPHQPNQPDNVGVVVGMDRETENSDEEKEREKNIGITERDIETDSLWLSFWSNYPKKTFENEAYEAWIALNPDESTVEKILYALEIAKKSEQWTKENGKYINKAVNWLNKKSWEGDMQENDSDNRSNNSTGFTTEGMSGFHNALDKYDDNGNEITNTDE